MILILRLFRSFVINSSMIVENETGISSCSPPLQPWINFCRCMSLAQLRRGDRRRKVSIFFSLLRFTLFSFSLSFLVSRAIPCLQRFEQQDPKQVWILFRKTHYRRPNVENFAPFMKSLPSFEKENLKRDSFFIFIYSFHNSDEQLPMLFWRNHWNLLGLTTHSSSSKLKVYKYIHL